MPTNKNALIRYKYLDEMLSNRYHYYTMNDLTNHCNKKLREAGLPEVTKRCIEKDILFLEYQPFFAEIERFQIDGKNYLRYQDPMFSIFKKALSEEESNLLLEVFNTIGQFDGLNNFEWLKDLKSRLSLKSHDKIIYFSNNAYLQNSELLGVLFNYISNKTVIELEYHTFNNTKKRKVEFHPYLLKQYNERWFVIGGVSDSKKMLVFALDRINNITALPQRTFIHCEIDLIERFEEIVGVTYHEDKQIEHIVFWTSDKTKDYIITKPIHGSQKIIKNDELKKLQTCFSHLKKGIFMSIDCIPNYELIRVLISYEDLVVISPTLIRNEIYSEIKRKMNFYSFTRT